jgi:nucleoid-associated protein YgaU
VNRRAIVIAAILSLGLGLPGCQDDVDQENSLLMEENEDLRARLAALREQVAREREPVVIEVDTLPVEPVRTDPIPRDYVVRSGDTLTLIALKVYGDRSRWPLIYDANRNVIGRDQNRLKVGMDLTIPPPPTTASTRR